MALEVILYPHPTLRHKSRPLKKVDAELRTMVAQMFDLMYEHEGIGLAANQVDLPYRLFVTNPNGDPNEKELEHVFINPVIKSGKGHAESDEGCLSIPGIHAPVIRQEKIKVQAYDLRSNLIEAELDGIFARVVQHETDHLEGVLFIDRLQPTHAASIKEQLVEFEIDFHSKRDTGEAPSDEQVASHIRKLEALRT